MKYSILLSLSDVPGQPQAAMAQIETLRVRRRN